MVAPGTVWACTRDSSRRCAVHRRPPEPIRPQRV